MPDAAPSASPADGASPPAPAPVAQGPSQQPATVATGPLTPTKPTSRLAGWAGGARRAMDRAWRAVSGLRPRDWSPPATVDQGRLDILRALADRQRAPRVLFVDGTNAARSQMAEAYALTLGLYAESAGTFPRPGLDPFAVAAMQERKMDISAWSPKILVPSRLPAFDRVIVMGDVLPDGMARGAHVVKWDFPLDPQGFPLQGYRLVRDQTEKQVRLLARKLAGLKTRRSGAAPASMQARKPAGQAWKAPEGPAVRYEEQAPPGGIPWTKPESRAPADGPGKQA